MDKLYILNQRQFRKKMPLVWEKERERVVDGLCILPSLDIIFHLKKNRKRV